MNKRKTYLDANVLIAAFQGTDTVSQQAMDVLDDPDREFVVSDYLRLEVLPKPSFLRRQQEVEFMQTVLDSAVADVPSDLALTGQAIELAARYDLNPVDALHASAAVLGKADELVTLERKTSPLCRVTEVKVISLREQS